jgi:dihydrofolate reductase
MPILKLQLTMSLDGYVAGPNQSVANPLGEGGGQLHEWAFATSSFRAQHGMEGGVTGPDDEIAAEVLKDVGATIMGRHMFGGGDGDWGDGSWTGWWGDDPPYHTPVFVLTHHPRAPLPMRGGTTFHFVTDGMEAALERARTAAGAKDVSIGGGADVARQYLRAGLIDEMDIHLVPVLLGSGARLFEDDPRRTGFELVRAVASPAVGHFKYRRRRRP